MSLWHTHTGMLFARSGQRQLSSLGMAAQNTWPSAEVCLSCFLSDSSACLQPVLSAVMSDLVHSKTSFFFFFFTTPAFDSICGSTLRYSHYWIKHPDCLGVIQCSFTLCRQAVWFLHNVNFSFPFFMSFLSSKAKNMSMSKRVTFTILVKVYSADLFRGTVCIKMGHLEFTLPTNKSDMSPE